MRDPPSIPPTRSPLLHMSPHLSQPWGTRPQLSRVLVPYCWQPAAVSLLQEAFSAERSGRVAAWTTLILQHECVLGAQAQEAAQQPASQSRTAAELEPSLSRGSSE